MSNNRSKRPKIVTIRLPIDKLIKKSQTKSGDQDMENETHSHRDKSEEKEGEQGVNKRQNANDINGCPKTEDKLPDFKNLKKNFRFIKDFHDVAFRILLIDDKIGVEDDKTRFKDLVISEEARKGSENPNLFEIKECEQCDGCNRKEPCKLRTIKELMSHKKSKDNEMKKNKISFHYWDQYHIKTYYCPTVIQDFIDDENYLFSNDYQKYPKRINVYSEDKDRKDRELNIKCLFEPNIYEVIDVNGTKEKRLNVQIVGVRDVRTALLLMSKYKFDMVFCDYLLDYKNNKSGRDYATQLLAFLSYDNKDEVKVLDNKIKELTALVENTDDEKKKLKRLEVLNQLRHDVLDNRGPIDKLWIMPITGFNQTFIQDLYRNRIDLIGHKWNISNGADPITTPWQFLYHLNKFVELQLKQCVYRMDHLLRFLLYTWEDLDAKLMGNDGRGDFYAFQAFMGSEYANFMRRYGNRHIIQRDAYRDNNDVSDEKSVFATYIWNTFYANPQNRNVIELNRLIHRFFHQAATMHNDRRGQQRLEETFGQLCFFVDTNQKVRDVIGQEEDLNDNKLDNALKGLREKMDMLTSNRHDGGSNNKDK